MATVMLNCPQVVLRPTNFSDPGGSQPVVFNTINDLAAAYTSLTALGTQTTYPTIADLATGHPGYPGGPPLLPSGTGVHWGVAEDGVEWWITDAEGLDDSAPWELSVVEPAAVDGSWLAGVRAPGREVTLRGVILADDPADLLAAKRKAAAALAVSPRTGRLSYNDAELSVALAGQTRIKHIGANAVEVEMSLRGIDIGTAGAGVFFEGQTVTQTLEWNKPETFTLGGAAPTAPRFRIGGSVGAGMTLEVNGVTITTTVGLSFSDRLDIDCRTRQVLRNGVPRRDAITLTEWPILTVGANEIEASQPGDFGLIRMTVTELF